MAEESEDPIHQAFWVFIVTAGTCYAFLGLVMFAKIMSGGTSLGDLGRVTVIQGGLLAVFLVLFGIFFTVFRKLVKT